MYIVVLWKIEVEEEGVIVQFRAASTIRALPPTNAYSAGNFAKEIRGFRWHSGRGSPRVGSLDGVKDLSLGEMSKDRRDNASSI